MYNLLLVDDMDILRCDVKRLDIWGETSGFQIAGEADNGEAAIELLKAGHFDLVITDIKMPIMNGIELLEAVKNGGLCPCVVFLSEYSDFSFAKKGIILGAFDYIVKPVNKEELLNMLGRVSAFLDTALREREERLREKSSNMNFLDNPALLYEKSQLFELIVKGDKEALNYAGRLMDILSNYSRQDITQIRTHMHNLSYDLLEYLGKICPWLSNLTDMKTLIETDYTGILTVVEAKSAFLKDIGCILSIIAKYLPIPGDNTVNQICTHILMNINENISLSDIAQRLYLNKNYMSHMFKMKTGTALIDYLVNVRIDRAKRLLSDSNIKTYEVSYMLGYNDPEYFSRLFKQHVGISPREFRGS